MKRGQLPPTRLRLSILADQLGYPAGGGRYIHGFLTALLSDPSIMNRLASVDIVVTENESVSCLGPLPSNVSIVRRRFPNRLRRTPVATFFGYALPAADVTFGPFYYAFPMRTRAQVVTVHDLSVFNDAYHPPVAARVLRAQMTRVAHECDGVVCISRTTLSEFQNRWPELAHKAVMIYNGVTASAIPSHSPKEGPDRSILTVGTLEPRKNYPVLLDAFERLVLEQGDDAPVLTVVGNVGWMSESVERRLLALQSAGRCRWLRNADDDRLAGAYASASVFTFLSLSEGFGYPPFEAANARCPMVLSSSSSVGEIWAGHARCVDPLDVEGIVAGWKWALSLDGAQREAVVIGQERRAREFTWNRAVNEYLAFWSRLVNKDGASRDAGSSDTGKRP